MIKFSDEQQKYVSDKIQELVGGAVVQLRKFYLKIIGGLGVVILLETGALIWSLAIGSSENDHQDEAIKALTETVKSNNDLIKEVAKSTITNSKENVKLSAETKANKDRLDRSPY